MLKFYSVDRKLLLDCGVAWFVFESDCYCKVSQYLVKISENKKFLNKGSILHCAHIVYFLNIDLIVLNF